MQLSDSDTGVCIFGVLVPISKCVSSRRLLWPRERKGRHGRGFIAHVGLRPALFRFNSATAARWLGRLGSSVWLRGRFHGAGFKVPNAATFRTGQGEAVAKLP